MCREMLDGLDQQDHQEPLDLQARQVLLERRERMV